MMFLNGCGQKTIVQTKLIKQEIPQVLLDRPIIRYRPISNQRDVSIFIYDLYEAYEQCVINLESIRRITNEY